MRAHYVQVMTSCAGGQAGQIGQYHAKLERVKFGVSLDQVCLPCNDLPGPLLVSISISISTVCSVQLPLTWVLLR